MKIFDYVLTRGARNIGKTDLMAELNGGGITAALTANTYVKLRRNQTTEQKKRLANEPLLDLIFNLN